MGLGSLIPSSVAVLVRLLVSLVPQMSHLHCYLGLGHCFCCLFYCLLLGIKQMGEDLMIRRTIDFYVYQVVARFVLVT